MPSEVENKMVIDSLWNDLDEIDEAELEEKEEEFYRRADMEYEDDVADLLERGWGHVNGYYL